MWVWLVLSACRGEKSVSLDSDTDTGLAWETGSTDDTGAQDSVETAETADTGDTAAPGWLLAMAAPDGLVVSPGATWGLSFSAMGSDGVWVELDGEWTSDQPEVVSVDGSDTATALAAGVAILSATAEGLSATAEVTVREDGLLTVTVIDASTGAVLPGATLVVDDGERTVDEDADGIIEVAVAESAGLEVTVTSRGYVPVTVWQTVGRSLSVPLLPETALDPAEGALSGAVDLSAIPEGEFGNARVGVASASVQGPALLLDPDSLMAANRTVSVFGVDAELPENVYVGGLVDDYSVPALPGPAAVWTLAGPMPVAELTAGLEGTGDVLALLQTYRDSLSWGYNAGGDVVAGETLTADLAPGTSLDQTYTVSVGALPLGFSGDEEVLVLVGQQLTDEGFVVTGFGLGADVVDVAGAGVELDGAVSSRALAIAQVGGLGEGGAMCSAIVTLDGDVAVTPALPEAPALTFDAATRTFALTTDAGADFVRARITSRDGKVRDLLLAGGSTGGILPLAGISFSYGSTTWELIGLHTEHGTFEGALAAGETDIEAMAEHATASARLTGKF